MNVADGVSNFAQTPDRQGRNGIDGGSPYIDEVKVWRVDRFISNRLLSLPATVLLGHRRLIVE
jgi:hypothetical protein